ncbi:MAG: hypothetical protein ABI811_07640 [Acidobacteriota bacterium]
MAFRIYGPLAVLLGALVAPSPALAQIDLTGIWAPVFHEDQPERIPGPALADYLGLPINDNARQWALAWDPDRLTAQEHQCQVHTAAYMYRGPLLLRVWDVRDSQTQAIVAQRQYINNYEQDRTIYLDGRPHPPEFAPHTWMGFSTGEWQGNIFTVYTTHIKQGWHRRNGLPSSDRIALTEHFIRHGDSLTHVSIVEDPDYLEAPLIKSQDFVLNPTAGWETQGTNLLSNWLYPCEYVEEAPFHFRDRVQSFLPGQNPFLDEFAKQYKIPRAAALGGAATMYPEYRETLPPGR